MKLGWREFKKSHSIFNVLPAPRYVESLFFVGLQLRLQGYKIPDSGLSTLTLAIKNLDSDSGPKIGSNSDSV